MPSQKYPTHISRKEHFQIARELEKHHTVFERIWSMGRIRFTKKTRTAFVKFNKKGRCVDFAVSPKFWEKCSFRMKCFVLAHECLHIALNHGKRGSVRGKGYKAKEARKIHRIINRAQDIVINHTLVNRYGFDRDEIDPIKPLFDRKGRPIIDKATGQQKMARKYCWVDQFFGENSGISEDENFEYYFNLLMKMKQNNPDKLDEKMDETDTVDEHQDEDGGDQEGEDDSDGGEGGGGDSDDDFDDDDEGGDGDSDSEGKDKNDDDEDDENEYFDNDGDDEEDDFDDEDTYSDDFDEIIKKTNDDMDQDEKEGLKGFVNDNMDSNPAPEGLTENPEDPETEGVVNQKPGQNYGGAGGNEKGKLWTFAKKVERPPIKKKFEHIVTSWAKKKLEEDRIVEEQWIWKNRRHSSIMQNGMYLPAEKEVYERTPKDRLIHAWFFQDTSASCTGYQDRFFSIAERMPEDKFDMRLFCFDTAIYETDLESRRLDGFGGTFFNIIENHIQRSILDATDPLTVYPDAVFIVTDGGGNKVVPQYPDRWHWIMTPNYYDGYIHEDSVVYDLSEYE